MRMKKFLFFWILFSTYIYIDDKIYSAYLIITLVA